jgi:hypothetical protein
MADETKNGMKVVKGVTGQQFWKGQKLSNKCNMAVADYTWNSQMWGGFVESCGSRGRLSVEE